MNEHDTTAMRRQLLVPFAGELGPLGACVHGWPGGLAPEFAFALEAADAGLCVDNSRLRRLRGLCGGDDGLRGSSCSQCVVGGLLGGGRCASVGCILHDAL